MQLQRIIIALIPIASLLFLPNLYAQYRELTAEDNLPDKYERMNNSSVTDYNNHYYTNFTNPKDIQQNMVKQVNAYYAALRTCTPGNYTYTMYDMSETSYRYQKATIRGFVQGQCVVEIREDNIDVPDVAKPYTTCNYAPDRLKSFTDQYGATLIKQGPTENAQNKVNQADLNECATFQAGRPTEIQQQVPTNVNTQKPVKYYQGDLQNNYPENQTDRYNEQYF